MPKQYYEEFEQDWETVIIKKENQKINITKLTKIDIPYHTQITFSRQQNELTQQDFAQALNVKLKVIEDIENGIITPDKKLITKMNKILISKIPYNKS